MKTLSELSRQAVRYDDINKVTEFMRLAIAVGGSRRHGDDIRTKVRRMSPRLDAILGDINEVFRMTPQNIADFEKAAVSVGSTTDSTWAEPLAAYKVVADAFAESLKNFGAFDRMLPDMRRVPLHSRVGMSTTGFTASTVAQHHPKPITKLSMTGTTLDERKSVAIAVLDDELMRFSMAAITKFQTELQNALAVETDETFVEILTSGATSFGSSGVSAEHVRNDLRAALGSITTGARSRLYLLMPSAVAKVLAVLYDESGGPAFPTMKVNGGDIAGMTVIVSDGVPSSTIILADATQIAAANFE